MNNKNNNIDIMGLIVRLIVSMVVVGLTNVLVPGMSNRGGLLNLAIIAIVIAVIQHLLASFLGLSKSGKGASGFLVMALVLYLSGMFISGYDVSILGALIGGIVYGLVSSVIPGDKLN